MLSICIPIYNQDVNNLISKLSIQVEKLDALAEIILIDDCSSEDFKRKNQDICKKHTYVKLKKNVGRAKIRNLFLNYVNFEYLLFLDCDATITNDTLLQVYIDIFRKENYKVYCGGSIYPKAKPSREYRLRWANGNVRETIPAESRKKKPYSSFMTSNVIIRKEVFKKIQFDESIVKYGHEDTLFGYALKNERIEISHIDNTVLNDDIDTNTVFLKKTEDALINLAAIAKKLEYAPEFINEIKLLKFYFTLKKRGLITLLNIVFRLSKKTIAFLFHLGAHNLYLFDFYKLGILSKAIKSNK